MEDVLVKLIEFVENASPAIWNVLIQQVFVEAWSGIAWVIVWLVVAVVLGIVAKQMYILAEYDPEYGEFENKPYFAIFICVLVFAIGFIFIAGALLTSCIKRFVNPDFYAIKFILNSIVSQ